MHRLTGEPRNVDQVEWSTHKEFGEIITRAIKLAQQARRRT